MKLHKEVVHKEVVHKEVVAKELKVNEVMDNEVMDNEVMDNEVMDNEVMAKEVMPKEVMLVHKNKETNCRYSCDLCGHNATTKTSLGNWHRLLTIHQPPAPPPLTKFSHRGFLF